MKSHLNLNRLGLFPAPQETEDTFNKRVKKILAKDLNKTIPLIETYQMSPQWVSVDYKNKGLFPWEGGCTWIFEEEGVIETTIQLRETFKKEGGYLNFYNKDEILIHELAHAARAGFEEPQFEEFLAYRTSQNKFRRELSPLIEHSYEATVFLTLVFFINLFLPFSFNILPLAFLILGILRLNKRHKTFQKAINRLKPLFKEETEAFLYRLKDEEIIFCAKHPLKDIRKKFSEDSFRYFFLRNCYPYLNETFPLSP
jgi:hypothetical protein